MSSTYLGAEIIGSLIGRQILADAITDTSLTIYHALTGIMGHSSPSVDNILIELDVNTKIKYLEEICNIISKTKHNSIIQLTLESIHEMILKISGDLKIIHSKLEYNKTSWKAYFRKKNLDKNIDNLKLHCNLLDNRLRLFTNSYQCFNLHT